ncbi:hypothetical protein [Natronobiforma cellulositropha]|uniref:hypothetical protein n=1 Tax=Natronobiforma cellulositropha TaxID=1679076 RepID=UPI0021D58EAE|nr:hypothetical protein [Natronobiforma cellulositropha]
MDRSSRRESCGRCSFTTVLDAADPGDGTGEDDRRARTRQRHDPFEGGAIEVDERDLRLAAAPAVAAARLGRWLDDTAARLIDPRR